MKDLNKYLVLGVMTGTSMDGIDLSLIKTDGINYVKIIKEENYSYSLKKQMKLKEIVNNKPIKISAIYQYFKFYEDLITKDIIKHIKKFVLKNKIKHIDIISLSGQTMYHNPKKNITIQLGNGEKISDHFKIKVITNFREKDIINGGEGAPIGSYYHRYLINIINKRAAIINIGGVTNLSQIIKRKLISTDIGPGNGIIDDLVNHFYKKKFDKDGYYASKGNIIKKIFFKFKKDYFFKKKYPKSLDRNNFDNYLNIMKKNTNNDSIATAVNFTIYSIKKFIDEKNNSYLNEIILTGGGRKNKFLLKELTDQLKKLKISKIDDYGFNGDLIESQMFGYIGIRCLKHLIISTPLTTNNKKPISGGKIYNPN